MIRLIGDGGHAKVVREVIESRSKWERRWERFGDYHFIAVGNNYHRRRESLLMRGRGCPPLVHKTAWVSPTACLGWGSIVMAGAVIHADAVIGKYCIINTGASVDHDCRLGDFVHVAPGVHLCGGVEVGDGCLLAVGLGFAPNSKIPAWSFVKAKEIDVEPLRDNAQL